MQFEFQIEELEHKIEELKKFAEEKEVDLSDEINKLKDQRDIALKVLYDNLTDYQRVAVSRHPERPYTLDYIENITTVTIGVFIPLISIKFLAIASP